ncbi:hypothetical protein ACFLWS_00215 [Chloroflexota bacterium]
MRVPASFLFTVIISLVILTGCGAVVSAPSGTADEIADKIFTESGVTFRAPERLNLEKDEDREFYLGSINYPEFEDSVAVVPMIRIDTRVLYVIKAANKGDIDTIKTVLKENIDPNRLICVTFSLEDVVIENRGNVIFMTINSDAEQRAALVEAFKTIE